MDASNPTQLSASCVLLLGLLSAEELAKASVLILFNKMYGSRAEEGWGGPQAWNVGSTVGEGVGGAAAGRASLQKSPSDDEVAPLTTVTCPVT